MSKQEQDRRMAAIEEMERELAEPLRSFRGAMTGLAEQHVARSARLSLVPSKKGHPLRTWAYAWAPAGALAILMAVGLVLSSHGPVAGPAAHESTMARVEQPAAPQQANGSTLMTEIDEDLNQNAPSPLAPLEVSTTSQTHTTTTEAEDTYSVEP
jgi:hypothetical protein